MEILSSHINEPSMVIVIHDYETVDSSGNTSNIYIGAAKEASLLVSAAAENGTASLLYTINVVMGSDTIKSYPGTAITSSGGTDSVFVTGVMGDWISVSWGGVDASNNFDGVTSRLIIK